MLTWNVTYHCKAGQRDAFYKAVTELGVRENSVRERGNRKYDYFLSLQNPDDLLLVETWTDPDCQAAHCATERFAQLQKLKEQYCASVEIDKFND